MQAGMGGWMRAGMAKWDVRWYARMDARWDARWDADRTLFFLYPKTLKKLYNIPGKIPPFCLDQKGRTLLPAPWRMRPLDLTMSMTSTRSTTFWYDQTLDGSSQNHYRVKSRGRRPVYYENC